MICKVSIMTTLLKFLGIWIDLSNDSSGMVAHGLQHTKPPITIVHGVKFPKARALMQQISMMLYILVLDCTNTSMV